MLIVKIQGGLGNQMFQYAFGRSLELRHNAEVKYDITDFKTYFREYELEKLFNIKLNCATEKEIQKLRDFNPRKIKPFKFLPGIIRKKFETYKQENNIPFDKKALSFKNNKYFDGYWQSENYFKRYEEVIRKEFNLKIPFDEQNNQLAREIKSNNSVGVHVRRGDYLTNTHILQVCSLEYYNNAINYISEKTEAPHFYIFSDDPEWADSHINPPGKKTIVTNNLTENMYIDMFLMSFCKHNIIANSSFSWWGAWLNENPDKIVIAPKNWTTSEMYSPDRTPSNWIRLDNEWVENPNFVAN